jgi:ribosomal protein S25
MTSMISILLFAKPVLPKRRIKQQPGMPSKFSGKPRSKDRAKAIRESILDCIGVDQWTVSEMADHLSITVRQAGRARKMLVEEGSVVSKPQNKRGLHLPTIYFATSERKPNATVKVDDIYLGAMAGNAVSTKDLSIKLGKSLSTVQRHVRRMEGRGLIKPAGKSANRANPAILWEQI